MMMMPIPRTLSIARGWPHWRRCRTCRAGRNRHRNWSHRLLSIGRASDTAAVRPNRPNTCPTGRLCILRTTCFPWSRTAGTPPGTSAAPRSAPVDGKHTRIFIRWLFSIVGTRTAKLLYKSYVTITSWILDFKGDLRYIVKMINCRVLFYYWYVANHIPDFPCNQRLLSILNL